jgi:hypothetical protein
VTVVATSEAAAAVVVRRHLKRSREESEAVGSRGGRDSKGQCKYKEELKMRDCAPCSLEEFLGASKP